MRNVRFLLVQLSAPAHAATIIAAQDAFPSAEVVGIDTVEEALLAPKSNCIELLVVGLSSSSAMVQATEAVNENGRPRWAIIHLGLPHIFEGLETVPPEEWQAPLLARVFKSAVLQHELRSENQRLRGDLKTVARRFGHDLTTPVACISTSASVLKIVPPDDTQGIATLFQSIDDSSAEILQLTKRVCFVLKASTDPVVIANVAMSDVVAPVLSQLDAQRRDIGATVNTPKSWPEVNGVTKWLQVIWWNFLSNALKHGGPGVQIRLDWKPDENGYRFCLYDNGSGVEPAMQGALFRPFDQLHTAHTAGLGLSIVQRLTSLQGGRCGYERTPEKEACFYFTLPAPSPRGQRDATLAG